MNEIELQRIATDGTTLRCEFDYPSELNGFFFNDEFVVEYDTDIGNLPRSILSIPWVANICPLAWAKGVDVKLPRLDTEFHESLTDVRQALEEMYPEFMRGSAVRVQQRVDNSADRAGQANDALLFSGGVDALATYYRHRDEQPALITIHGFDVSQGDSETWEAKREQVEEFARSFGAENFYIKTNMMSFLEDFMLNAHFRQFLQSDWYDAVQQGLGITGLCAPLAFVEGFDTIYMADGASETYDIKVGNHPKIVNSVRWDSTAVQNDGFELTRQEKIELLADFLRKHEFELHTCLEPGPGNCGECEKCLRTAFGLVLADLDPSRYGYQIDENSFRRARENLVSGGWKLGPAKASMWRDLKDHAERESYPTAEAEAFFQWLAKANIDQFVDPSNSSGFLAYRLTRTLPAWMAVHKFRRQVLDVIW